MSKLPRDLSGCQVRRALGRAGFYLKRQKGSHMVLRRDTGTLAAILDAAGLDAERLRELL